MKFLLATNNPKKVLEMKRILSPLGVQTFTAADLNIKLSEPEENGETFAQNAQIKALNGCRETGLACIADDSGLCVDALNGRPGVHSARYGGGHDVGYDKKIACLLDELKDVPDSRRTARFVCCVCCVFPDGRELVCEGRCEGVIGRIPAGGGGFGYDPIFYVGENHEKSFAQLTDSEKDAVSHRGAALKLLREKLGDYL